MLRSVTSSAIKAATRSTSTVTRSSGCSRPATSFGSISIGRPTRLSDPARRVQVSSTRDRGLRTVLPTGQARRVRRLRLRRRLWRHAGRRPSRGGALLLLRAIPDHRPSRRLPRLRRDSPPLSTTRKHIEQPALLLYRVVDGLVDSFFPVLAAFDDRIDELEDAIFLKADDDQLQEIFKMKRLLVGMRKGGQPAARHVRAAGGRDRGASGFRERGRALLPRYLRPPDPNQRPHRQLPRPAHGCDGRLPVHRLESPELPS